MHPFIIIKPEGLVCVSTLIDQFLFNSGFRIISKTPIREWEDLARKIYPDLNMRGYLEAYLKTIAVLFPECGSFAMLVDVNHQTEEDLTEQIRKLNKLKHNFRKLYEPSKVISLTYVEIGSDIPVHLTYIHVPDPVEGIINAEWTAIEQHLAK
jgi:hypothetical protein